jgi:hypothetical protein
MYQKLEQLKGGWEGGRREMCCYHYDRLMRDCDTAEHAVLLAKAVYDNK